MKALPEGYDIRYTTMEDTKPLLEWLSDPKNLEWFPMSEGKELEDATRNWIGFSRYKCGLTAMIHNEPVAIGNLFLMPYRKVAHECMFYMIVKEEFRHLGIGTSLLKNLLHLANHYFRLESIYAEVYSGCPIIPLLQQFKFEKCVHQEKFVKENGYYRSREIFEKFF